MNTEKVLRLCVLAFGLTAGLHVNAQQWDGVHSLPGCFTRSPGAKAEDYQSWIKPYTKLKGDQSNNQDVDLSLTVLDGDNLAPDPSKTWLCGNFCCQMTTTYSVSSSGMVAMIELRLWLCKEVDRNAFQLKFGRSLKASSGTCCSILQMTTRSCRRLADASYSKPNLVLKWWLEFTIEQTYLRQS